MKTSILAAAVMALLGPCTQAGALPAVETETVAYRCDDLVVVGRVRNLDYTPLNDPNDIVGNGLISMSVRVSRVLEGREIRRRVPAVTIAHANLREDRDFLLVLTRGQDGDYRLRSAYLWRARPRPVLANACERP